MTVSHIPVIAAVSKPSFTEEIVEKKPFKRLKVKASSSTGPIINLVDSDLEEEVIASAPVTAEVDQYLQSLTDLFDGDGKKDSIPVSTVSQSSSVSVFVFNIAPFIHPYFIYLACRRTHITYTVSIVSRFDIYT